MATPSHFLSRSGKGLLTRLNADHVTRRTELATLKAGLEDMMERHKKKAVVLESIDGVPARDWSHVDQIIELGFRETSHGLMLRLNEQSSSRSSYRR